MTGFGVATSPLTVYATGDFVADIAADTKKSAVDLFEFSAGKLASFSVDVVEAFHGLAPG